MAKYENLIQIDGVEDDSTVKSRATIAMRRAIGKAVARSKIASIPRGCDDCPSKKNWQYGVEPVMGKVRGKDIFIWAMCPGRTENEKGRELLGRAGKLLWDTLESVGIERSDCDIQNVVRCFTVDVMDDGDYLRMRNPSKAELHCCSLYTDKALKKSKARVHVVLGVVAQQQLLGAEYKKNRKVFYSDRFKAWIICADHPAFFIRQGGDSGEIQHSARFKDWVKLFEQVKRLAKVTGGRWAYLEKQDYKYVVTAREARRADREIRRECEKTYVHKGKTYRERLSVDYEEGRTYQGKPDDGGDPTSLVLGFCPKPGMSRVFWLDHPDLPKPRTARDRKVVYKIARRLLNSDIPKVLQKGNYDVDAVQDQMHAKLVGYDYDTMYGEYFANPEAKAYGLLATANRRVPQMAGYKEIVVPEALEPDFAAKLPKKLQEQIANGTADWSIVYEKSRKGRGQNLARLPWKKMLLYNGADCDIQKRIEISTRAKVNMPLMHVYRDAGFILSRMSKYDSPTFDYRHHRKLSKFFPVRLARTLKEIRRRVKKILRKSKPIHVVKTKKNKEGEFWHCLNRKSWKTFNPSSDKQVKDLLYNWLKLPVIETKKNKDRKTGNIKPTTDKEVMLVLAEYHPLPKLVQDYRHDRKVCSTYLDGFYNCAEANGGKLRTKWNETGASTGRISSGGGQKQVEDEEQDVVNLQNVHGDPQLQCLIISDENWYKLQEWWNENGPIESDEDIPDWVWDMDVFLAFDHAQMELRVLAQKSQDKALIYIFSREAPKRTVKKKKCIACTQLRHVCVECMSCHACCPCTDPHALVGHELTGWSVVVIKNDERVRRIVKNMQFGIVFGLNEDNLFDYMVGKGVYKYSDGSKKGDREEKASRKEVRRFHRKYFKKFKGVAIMIEQDRAFAEEHGYMKTMTGLMRPLQVNGGEDESKRQSYWGNQAVNGPIQGTASHIMLMGLVPLKRKPKTYRLLKHPQMEIHDAVYFKLKLRKLWKAAKLGKQMLEKEPLRILRKEFGINWKVPLVAEPKAGFRFGMLTKDIHKITGDNRTAQFLNMWCTKNKLMMGSLRCQMKGAHGTVITVKKGDKTFQQCTRCGKALEKEIAA